MKTFSLPEDLRLEIEEALGGKPINSTVGLPELEALIRELQDPDLKKRLYAATIGARAAASLGKAKEAARKGEELRAGIGTRRDEQGRRRPNRQLLGNLLVYGGSLLAILIIGYGIWSSFGGGRTTKATEQPAVKEQPAPTQPTNELPVAEEPVPPPPPPPPVQTPAEPLEPAPAEPTVAMPTLEEGIVEGAGEVGGAVEDERALGGGGAALPQAVGGGGAPRPLASGVGVPYVNRGGRSLESKGPKGGGGVVLAFVGGGGGQLAWSGGGGLNAAEEPTAPELAADLQTTASAPAPSRVVAPRPALPSVRETRQRAALERDLTPGRILRGQVDAGVVLAAGLSEVPVTARDDQGRIWMGVARLAGASGRAYITFDELVVEGEVVPVRAVALGADKAFGVPLEARDVSPTLAASMIRASISGIAAYVKALERQKRVYRDAHGNLVEETAAPPTLEWQVAKRVAELFELPIDEQTVRRVYVLKHKTPVYVLVQKVERTRAVGR